MREFPFVKMQGAGNDYVFVDLWRTERPTDPANLARRLSDRHFGIGSDGLILIGPSDIGDARMEMWNADGSRGEMCGNGARCVGLYVANEMFFADAAESIPARPSQTIRLETDCGVVEIEVRSAADGRSGMCRINMGEPILCGEQIPTRLTGSPPLAQDLAVDEHVWQVNCVSMGNPHCVVFVDELSDDLLATVGPALECHQAFPQRANIEFVQIIDRSRVRVRVWERGSGETMACGTGACAVGVVGILTGQTSRQLVVELPGGELSVEWSERQPVFLTGPAVEVFRGVWNCPGDS